MESGLLPLNGQPSWAVHLHLLDAAGYDAPVIRLQTFSGFVLDLVVRGYLERVLSKKKK